MNNAQNNQLSNQLSKAPGLSLALSSVHTGRAAFLMQSEDYIEPKEYLIPLGGQKGKGGFAIVDKEDYPTLLKNKWTCNNEGYVVRVISLKDLDGNRDDVTIYMHQQIMNTPPGHDTHHKNENRRDNRKHNLLVCTRQEHINTDQRFTR